MEIKLCLKYFCTNWLSCFIAMSIWALLSSSSLSLFWLPSKKILNGSCTLNAYNHDCFWLISRERIGPSMSFALKSWLSFQRFLSWLRMFKFISGISLVRCFTSFLAWRKTISKVVTQTEVRRSIQPSYPTLSLFKTWVRYTCLILF